MGGQLTKEEPSIESSSSVALRNPFDLNKEQSETTKIIKVDEQGDKAQEAEDEVSDFDPNNYDPKTVGPILPNGDINWDCPCLGGAAHGPCGTEFRQAFSCFHYSQEDPKGSDCFPQFREMHVCFSKYPQIFNNNRDDDDDEEEEQGDPIQFDEDEMKIINEEDDNTKNSPAEQQTGDENKPSSENQKGKESSKNVKLQNKNIASQPAVM
jgi:intermembrane space import and assembly protein 40